MRRMRIRVEPESRRNPQTAADKKIRCPAQQADHDEYSELCGIIAQQEMRLNDMPSIERRLEAERQGSKTYGEAQQPGLSGEEPSCAPKGTQLQFRGKRRWHSGGKVVRPLKTKTLGQLRILL